MLKATELPMTDQLYTHFDQATGEQIDIAATRLVEWCKNKHREIVIVPVEARIAHRLREVGAIEGHRLRRLVNLISTESNPICLVQWEPNLHLFVDGAHRYCMLHIRRVPFAHAYMVERKECEPFLVEGISRTTQEKLLTSWSGVK